MKKFIFALLLLTMTFTAVADDYWANGIRYEVIGENTVRVVAIPSGYNNYSGVLTIPKTAKIMVTYMGSHVSGSPYYRSYRVTEIGEGAFRDCTGLTGIVLPNTITRINDKAFYGCTGLTSVTIPNTVNYIGLSAFGYCTSLSSIVLPNSVSQMGWNVFYGCSSLTSVTLPNGLREINGTFRGCSALTSVNIPSGVTKLDATFTDCTSLTEVNMPPTVSRIDKNTFDGCSALTHIYLPNSVVYIGYRAFANTGLTELELPDGVTTIGEDAFYGSTSLTSVSVRAANPPLMANSNAFSFDTYGQASLLVPEASLADYRSTDWWRVFMNITADAAMNNTYDFESDGIYYKITGSNTVEVTFKDRTYKTYSGEVTIPASVSHEGVTYAVTGVGNSAFRLCNTLTSVSLPSTVTRIGKHAFYSSGLTGISLPEAVTFIGDSAYMSCSKLNNLASLTVPRNVTTIGNNAFNGVQPRSLTWNALECWTNGGMSTYYLNQLTIGDEVVVLPSYLAQNSDISQVVLPNSLTTIGENAFYGVDLTSLTVPENVVTVQDAFYCPYATSLTWNARECWTMDGSDYCPYRQMFSNVTDLTIGDQVTVLPQDFMFTASISSLTIPASVKFIAPYAFMECENLKKVVIPDGVEEIGPYAFYESGVTEMSIGKNVKIIGGHVLSNVTDLAWNATDCEAVGDYVQDYYYYYNAPAFDKLERLTFGDNVKSLPKGFAKESQLKSFEFSTSIETIRDDAFSNCELLSDVSIPGSIDTIGPGAFSNCPGLTYVSIPASVKSLRGFENCDNLMGATISASGIGENAFSECDQLSDLTLSAPVESIGLKAFSLCPNLKDLYIPNTVTSITGGAFVNCNGLETIAVAEDNPVYDSRDNCNAVLETATDALVLTCENTVIPTGITAIGDYAFYNKYQMTSYEIPSTVTSIGKYAFGNCFGLTGLNIPEGVNHIGEGAFSSCVSMQSVNIPDGMTSINDKLFYGCRKLKSMTLPNTVSYIGESAFALCDSLKSVNIPDGVTAIKNETFYNCGNLTDITIPESVTSIGYNAFRYCRKLTQVTIPEAVTSIGSNAFYYCSGLTSFTCLAPTPPVIDCEVHEDYDGYTWTEDPYYTFYPMYNSATLYVPQASVDAYKEAECWKNFKTIVGIEENTPGDVDGDGMITISDTATLIGLLLNGGEEIRSDELPVAADVNGDGMVTIDDVTALINMLLTME